MGLDSTFGVVVTQDPLTVQPLVGPPWWGKFNKKLGGHGGAPGQYGFVLPPSDWDVVCYGPNLTPLPGLAKIRRCERRMKLHRKEHPSSDFEDQTFQGWSVVEFDFDLEMWTASQLSQLSTALQVIFPGAGDPPNPDSSVTVTTVTSAQNLVNPSQTQAIATQSGQQIQTLANTPKRPPIPIQVSHPALQLHGVNYLVFQYMEGPRQKSEQVPDIFTVRFKCVQWRPAKPIQHGTLTQANTAPTNLGANPGPGIQAAQQVNLGPSQSGGADPGAALAQIALQIPQGPIF